MSIINKYLKLQDEYVEKYGKEKTVVFMQVGSFFEAYATNTRGFKLGKLADILNIIVSKKNKKIKEVSIKNPYILGFPTVAASKYLKILTDNGFTIPLIEQVTDPPNPKRALTGIYSPGTVIDNLNSPDSNYILSIYIEEEKQLKSNYNILCVGLSVIDLSVGKSVVHEVFSKKMDEKYSLDEALKFINCYSPKEIIITTKNIKSLKEDQLIMYLELDDKTYHLNKNTPKNLNKISYQNEFLSKIYKDNSFSTPIEFLDLEKKQYCCKSFIVLLNYCYDHNSDIINNLDKPNIYEDDKYLHIGNNAIFQIDILSHNNAYSYRSGCKFKSLFDVINCTTTSMGKRFLKESVTNPLFDEKILNSRYNSIEEILKTGLYKNLREVLKDIIDIERLHRKMSLGTLHPSDFYNLHETYNNILDLYNLIKSNDNLKNLFPKNIVKDLLIYVKSYEKIFDIEEMCKYLINDITGSFYKKGVYNDIDIIQKDITSCRNFMSEITDELDKYIEEKRKKDYFSESSDDVKKMVRVEYNDREKHFLVLTQRRAEMLKKNLLKLKKIKLKSGLIIDTSKFQFKNYSKSKNTKIFFDDMDKTSYKLTGSIERLKSIIKKNYINDLLNLYEKNKSLMIRLTEIVSEIDFLVSGAIVSVRYNYCKPVIEKEDTSYVNFTNLRHPIIERINDTEYIPHSMCIGKNNNSGILLFGLNSSGKSCLMKAIGLSVILSQIGYFVPAEKYVFSPYKSLFTRISGHDNIFKGLSSFALEITELKAILKRSGKNTLVIADEVCRGTEHKSAIVIVIAMIDILSKSNTSFISATHLHEIVENKRIQNLNNVNCFHLHAEYDKKTNTIIYDRKLRTGNGKTEYGLDVSKCIMNDSNFIDLVTEIKKDISKTDNNLVSNQISHYNRNIYMTECDICECKENLDTHHIEFQKNTDGNGFLLKKSHVHKNHPSNLVVLCKDCHHKIHNNSIIINGYIETSNGNKLDYYFVKNKKKNNKFDKKTIDIVFNIKKIHPKISQKNAKKRLLKEHNIKISTTTISKIWKQEYCL